MSNETDHINEFYVMAVGQQRKVSGDSNDFLHTVIFLN